MAKRNTSIKVILDRLLRNKLLKGITFEQAVDYTVDFFEIVGMPDIYEKKLLIGTISDFRYDLPCDFINEEMVLINNLPARGSTDTFHEFYKCLKKDIYKSIDYSYSISNYTIYTSVEKGNIKIAYWGILTDDDGYPLIPEDRVLINALESFIKWKYYIILWENGKIPDKVYQRQEQEYMFNVGQAEARLQQLSLGDAEALFNSFKTLIMRDNEFVRRWVNDGSKELLKVN